MVSLFHSILKLLLIIYCISFVTAADHVKAACKQAMRSKRDYHFCVRSLRAVPESKAADTAGLASIATELAKTSFAGNLAMIDKLRLTGRNGSSTTDSASPFALAVCSRAYKSGVRSLGKALAGIESGRFGRALKDLLNSSLAPMKCDDAFAGVKAKKLLGKEDDYASKLNFVAVAVTALLTA